MAYDEALAKRIRHAIARKKDFTEKKMFGGVGFMLNGNLCCGIWQNSLVVRLSAEDYEKALTQQAVKKFDITGRPMTSWVLVRSDGIKGKRLEEWIKMAIRYVSALPPK